MLLLLLLLLLFLLFLLLWAVVLFLLVAVAVVVAVAVAVAVPVILVAEVLRLTLRRSDVIARVGGDEFVAVLPDVGIDGAMIAADNIEYALAQASIDHPDLPPLKASIGVTSLEPGETFGELLDRADREMLAVKEAKKAVDAADGYVDA